MDDLSEAIPTIVLERGASAWSYNARSYWTEPVVEKWHTNRSYTIAHNLEHLCEGSTK